MDLTVIRVLVVDDHAIVRKGIRALLAEFKDIEVIGEASDGQEAIDQADILSPDVILMDLVVPGVDGIEATRQITAAEAGPRILVLTSFAGDDKVFPAIKAGALGYLLKNSEPADLVEAIQQVYRGEPSLQPSIAQKVLKELRRSSARPPTPGPAHGTGDGGPTFGGERTDQSRDRPAVGDHRSNAAHPREQHSQQVAPGKPGAGDVVRFAGRDHFVGR